MSALTAGIGPKLIGVGPGAGYRGALSGRRWGEAPLGVSAWVLGGVLLLCVECPAPGDWALGLGVLLALPYALSRGWGPLWEGVGRSIANGLLIWGGLLGGGLLGGEGTVFLYVFLMSLTLMLAVDAPSSWGALLTAVLLPLPLLALEGDLSQWFAGSGGLQPFVSTTLLGAVVNWYRSWDRRRSERVRGELMEAIGRDPLTGLSSRVAILGELRSQLLMGQTAILYIDIDHFKAINDTLGHHVGDAVLVHLGGTLARVLPPGATAGRLGGKEFLVVLPECTAGEARLLGESILRPNQGPVWDPDLPDYSMSIGVASALPGESWESCVNRGDNALYAAKRRGRARVEEASSEGAKTAAAPPSLDHSIGLLRVREAHLETEHLNRSLRSFVKMSLLSVIVLLATDVLNQTLADGAKTTFLRMLMGFALMSVALVGSGFMGRFPKVGMTLLAGGANLTLFAAWVMSVGPYGSLISAALLLPVLMALALPLPPLVAIGCLWSLVACGLFAAFNQGEALPWAGIILLCGGNAAVAYALGLVTHHLQMGTLEDELGLEHLAHYDSLTGLLNRQTFLQRGRVEGPGALILMDLDHFKAINDTHGHEGGDRVLREVGALLGAACPDPGLCGRLGGEELAIFLPGRSVEGGAAVAEALLAQLRGLRILWKGRALGVSASAGVAEGELGDESLSRRADRALYQAKSAGRDQVVMNAWEGEAPLGNEGVLAPGVSASHAQPEDSLPTLWY